MRRNNRTRAGAGVGGGGGGVAAINPGISISRGRVAATRAHENRLYAEEPSSSGAGGSRRKAAQTATGGGGRMAASRRIEELYQRATESTMSSLLSGYGMRKGLSESIPPATLIEHVVADATIGMQQQGKRQRQQRQLAGYRQAREAHMIIDSDGTSGEDDDDQQQQQRVDEQQDEEDRYLEALDGIRLDEEEEEEEGDDEEEVQTVVNSSSVRWSRRQRKGGRAVTGACDTTSASVHGEEDDEEEEEEEDGGRQALEGQEEDNEYEGQEELEGGMQGDEEEEYEEAADGDEHERQQYLEDEEQEEVDEEQDQEYEEQDQEYDEEAEDVEDEEEELEDGQHQATEEDEEEEEEDDDDDVIIQDEVIDVDEHDEKRQLQHARHKEQQQQQQQNGTDASKRQDSPVTQTQADIDELEMIKISAINTKVQLNDRDKVSLEDFELLKVLGTGAYGTVYLVQKLTGVDKDKIYAMKVLKKGIVSLKKKTAEHTRTERQVLEAIQEAPFLVTMHYAFQTDSKLYLILDYVIGGELFTLLCNRMHFDEPAVQIYIAEIIVAIEHLHKLGIVYRDIKLENILVDVDGHIVLTDFGLSRELVYENERAHSFCGTVEYMAPEILKPTQQGHDSAVDWWSVGVLTFELLTGASPFTADQNEIARRITETEAIIPENLSPEATDFIRRLLVKDPKRRLGSGKGDASELKSHPFLRSINWSRLVRKQIEAPYPPLAENDRDTRNFSSEFTKQEVTEKPCEPPKNADRLFRGYSYVSPKLLTKNVTDRNKFIPIHNKRPLESYIRRSASKQSPFFRKYELTSTPSIGSGAYSTCLKCQRLRSNSVFAVKVLFNHPHTAAFARHEADALRQCQGHPHVVRFVELLEDANYIYLVLELLEGGELLQHLNRQQHQLTEGRVRGYFSQLVDAVAYIHRQGYAHRDLKPENVMLERSSSDQLRLIDFGFAQRLDSTDAPQPAGTLGYAAPEVLVGSTGQKSTASNSSYSLETTDLWSLGVILYTMLCGQAPFTPRQFFGHDNLASTSKQMEIITDKIRRGSFDLSSSIWMGVSEGAKSLVRSLLTVNPDQRITMQELLGHEWLLCESSGGGRRGQQHSLAPYNRGLPSQARLPYEQLQTNVRNTYDAFKLAEQGGFRLQNEGSARRQRSAAALVAQTATVSSSQHHHHRSNNRAESSSSSSGQVVKSNSKTTAVPDHRNASPSSKASKRTTAHHQQQKEEVAADLSVSTTKSVESQYSSSLEESTSSGIGRSKSSKSSLSHSGSPMRDARHLSNGSVVIVLDDDEDEVTNVRQQQQQEEEQHHSSAAMPETSVPSTEPTEPSPAEAESIAPAVERVTLQEDESDKDSEAKESGKDLEEEKPADEIVADVEEVEEEEEVDQEDAEMVSYDVANKVPEVEATVPEQTICSSKPPEAEKNNNELVVEENGLAALATVEKSAQAGSEVIVKQEAQLITAFRPEEDIMGGEDFSDTTKAILGDSLNVVPPLDSSSGSSSSRGSSRQAGEKSRSRSSTVRNNKSKENERPTAEPSPSALLPVASAKSDKNSNGGGGGGSSNNNSNASNVNARTPNRTPAGVRVKKEKEFNQELPKPTTTSTPPSWHNVPKEPWCFSDLITPVLVKQDIFANLHLASSHQLLTAGMRSLSVASDDDDVLFLGTGPSDVFVGFEHEECVQFIGFSESDCGVRSQFTASDGKPFVTRQERQLYGQIRKRRPELCVDEPRPKRLRQLERKDYSLSQRRRPTLGFDHILYGSGDSGPVL
ncbi:uncharacterized protein LOC121591817 [Anopheles merus]|uniref:uncharacterized protein LOC121591817 n=1 Tax=Anopheles merus TaxID=30066 RepID=UPI001BE4434E|nr:uncharacterized protein LOC121591817 [Anopheles merus]XP_041768749.1 uncharacterized protein LOC121591817 [Anopheles merus]XP_041768750.1 uncharacterized protein LOC121591817 [Anopheles merus]XP_041768752.1 uncharacterized protein LOC121591817 [Anopheles merus]XP_041768753.1 uncharacterized protein LOC121591817 [Anopheles merus]XP_041768754.1 uncharacterized protein LOC121591817 [Anopheles merus]XP_041768755.1 uncharacterized protein LOC121591817 [Anopheles merus]